GALGARVLRRLGLPYTGVGPRGGSARQDSRTGNELQGRSTSAGEGAHMHLFLVRQPLAEQVADARARTVDTAIRTRVLVSIEERASLVPASLVPRRKFI